MKSLTSKLIRKSHALLFIYIFIVTLVQELAR